MFCPNTCLALSRSTIYYWVKDIPIPRKPNGGWPESAGRKGNRAMLLYHADQDLNELQEFWWAGELRIDVNAIHLQRKSNSNGLAARSWRSRHGVLTVATHDTCLRARVQAWMDCIRDEWMSADTLDRNGA